MKKYFSALTSTVALFLIPFVSNAALDNPLGATNDLYGFLENLLRLIAEIAFPIIVLFLVYIGFLFVVNGSKPEELKKTRQYFLYAVIGALLVLGAYALSLAIQATVEQL